MQNSQIIRANHLIKTYGKGHGTVHALRDVSVEFTMGQLTAIMGPSGSGKSTLMHMLAGLDQLTSGEVYFKNQAIHQLNDKQLTLLRRREIGFIFQSFNLLPMFTAKQNIVLPLTLGKNKLDQRWFDQLVSILGLGDRLDHHPSELSGGQQQRVAIARALITKPQVVFADEPTGNLDSASGREVLQLLRQLVNELGQTVVMVTHDSNVASYADRALILADGRIVNDIQNPRSEQLAELILQYQQGGVSQIDLSGYHQEVPYEI